jgi:DAK2 domain fusion protein YloV
MTSEIANPLLGEIHSTPNIHLDGQGLKICLEAAITWLKTNQQIVNSLNVFPVPDGDTGTNMLLTLQAAINEIVHSEETNIGKIAHAVAQGALLGARGNSGVILSQLLRGFARTLDNLETIEASTFVRALVEAKNTAYKGVVRPVEGTILTVAKDIASEAETALLETKDLLLILERIVDTADNSVRHTPELLPILKQAGVVDSGGKGLFFILEGILRFSKGQPLDTSLIATTQPLSFIQAGVNLDSIEPGQDYEVVIDFRPNTTFTLDNYYSLLSEIGTSIQIGEGDGMYRMHIHVPTEKRYAPIDCTLQQGTITKVYLENLLDQMQTLEKSNSEGIKITPVTDNQIAVIAVSPGKGISRIFASLGVAGIVEGGQSMNPSTEEILHAFENLPTDKVIILPNNKNIILAAQNAASVSVKKTTVIPSKSIPQGLNAMLRLIPDGDLDQITSEMNDSLNEVETGEITIATRSVEINGVHVHEGEVIALLNGILVKSCKTLEEACQGLLKEAGAEEKERVTMLYGDNIEKEAVTSIVNDLQKSYPHMEFEIHNGGQPHYQFIISIE